MDSITVGINKLSLQPDDVLLISVPDDELTAEVQEAIGDTMRSEMDMVRFIIAPASFGFTVLRNGQPVTPEVDTPIEVEVR